MKLINHNKNNSYDINTYVMRGTIEMTRKEFCKVFKYLTNEYHNAELNCITQTRDGLSHAVDGFKSTGNLFNLGVCATGLIVSKYGLKNYKQQNYGILITE